MIKYDHIMIRYGELSAKGQNRKDFIRSLIQNVKAGLKDWPSLTYIMRYDNIYVS